MNVRRTLFLAFLILFGCKRQPAEAASPQQHQIPPSVSAQRRTPVVVAVHNVLPAVVNIQTEATIRRRELDPFFGMFGGFDRTYRTQSVGSGFVWSSNGVVVTNAHVVEGASSIAAMFHDGSQKSARVIGVDPDSDLAVLRVDAKNLPAASLGSSSDLLIGETVIAVGNPFGLGGSVTTGIVSATGRSVPSKEHGRTYTDFIQTDASINPGNSGGPLLNIEGRVIGINVAIHAQAQGIGFAIPVDRAKRIVEDLLRYGEVHRAWIGAATATITPEEARRLGLNAERGALVTRVFADSPAGRAGIKPGDVIVRVGNSPVDSRESFATLSETVGAGTPVRVTVMRGDRRTELTVTPIDPPRNLGLRILEEVSGIRVTERGDAIFVRDVARGSRAEDVGLAQGDRIVAANGIELDSLDDLDRELLKSADRSSFVLSVQRGRFIYTLTFPLGIEAGVAF